MAINSDKLNAFMGKALGSIGVAMSANMGSNLSSGVAGLSRMPAKLTGYPEKPESPISVTYCKWRRKRYGISM